MIDEFIFKAKSKGFEYIKEVRKKFSYVHPDSGEVIESKDKYEFLEALMDQPAPSTKTRNDTSATVFEYICGRVKITGANYAKLVTEVLDTPKEQKEQTEE